MSLFHSTIEEVSLYMSEIVKHTKRVVGWLLGAALAALLVYICTHQLALVDDFVAWTMRRY